MKVKVLLLHLLPICFSNLPLMETSNNTLLNRTTYSKQKSSEALLHAIFWEVKPFLFVNKYGELDGIVPTMFKQAQYYCLKTKNKSIKIIEFKRRIKERQIFYNLVRSNTSYGEGLLTGFEKTKTFWVPVISYTDLTNNIFRKKRNLRIFQLMKSKEIVVIVPRSVISLPNKIIRGILSCQQIFVLALLLAVLFGLLLWIIERKTNSTFPLSFTKGLGTSLYWSVVSMTTVGYGDVTPRTILGRFVAGFWLFVGVMLGCVMTATMTDIVTGVSDLDVYGKRVSVLENSFEQRVATQDYKARAVPARSYEDVLNLVRQKKVFAAMMNADVAAWYQNEIQNDNHKNPLRIVRKLPANLQVNCFVPIDVSNAMKKIFKCMYYQRDEVYTYSVEQFQQYCHTDTLYIGSMSDLLRDNIYVQVLLGLVCGLIFLGASFDFCRYWFKKPEKKNVNTNSAIIALMPHMHAKDTDFSRCNNIERQFSNY